MHIITPLTCTDDYYELVLAGADEFYCGFTPYSWLTLNKNVIPLNRRENILGFNITSFASMEILAKYVEKYKVPISITLNSHYYHSKDYGFLESYLRQLIAIGFDRFILADIALVYYIRERGIPCKLTLSGDAMILNQDAMTFLKQFDLERIIFPRMYTIEDMKDCIKGNSQYSYEAFVLNSFCYYDSMMCNSLHCDEFCTSCMIPYNIKKKSPDVDKYLERYYQFLITNKMRKEHVLPGKNESFGASGCGLCKIKDMLAAGVDCFKIVGRGFKRSRIVRDIQVI